MSRISLNEVHEKILEKLTEQDFLCKLAISEERMQAVLLSNNFINRLSIIIGKEKVNCQDVEWLSQEIFYSCRMESPDDLIKYSYAYIEKNIVFSGSYTKDDYKYEKAIFIFLKLLECIMLFYYSTEFRESGFHYWVNRKWETGENGESEYKLFLEKYKNNFYFQFLVLNNEIMNDGMLLKLNEVCDFSMKLIESIGNKNVIVEPRFVIYPLIIKTVIECLTTNFEKEKYRACLKDFIKRNNFVLIGNIAENSEVTKLHMGHLPLEALIIIYGNLRISFDKKSGIKYLNINEIFEILYDNFKNDKIVKSIINIICDLEEFFLANNINIKFASNIAKLNENKAFLEGKEIVSYIKNIAIKNNLFIMGKLYRNSDFTSFMAEAKASNSWREILVFIRILDEFNIYLDSEKKDSIVKFFGSFIDHHDDGGEKIEAARVLGKILLSYDGNRFEVWKQYFLRCISKYEIEEYEDNLLYAHCLLKSLTNGISDVELEKYAEYIISLFNNYKNNYRALVMIITTLSLVDISRISSMAKKNIIDSIIELFNSNDNNIIVIALYYIYKYRENDIINDQILKFVSVINENDKVCVNFLKYKILLSLDRNIKVIREYNEFLDIKRTRISEIFLSNLKADTNWIEKTINIDFLLDIVKKSNDVIILHTATHLCNLVKSSAKEIVRSKAGKGLISVSSFLTVDQRNEISIELLKGIESEEQHFSRNIPECLGRFVLMLDGKELDEIINDIGKLLNSSNDIIAGNALKVFTIMLEQYLAKNKGNTNNVVYDIDRVIKILRNIVSGMINDSIMVRMDTLFFFSKYIFNSNKVVLENKFFVFKSAVKKMLNLLNDKKDTYVHYLNDTIAIDYIYTFIKNYRVDIGEMVAPVHSKIAYYLDEFNPFIVEHKKVVEALAEQGYEVYININEFKCDTKKIPYKIRSEIIDISISDQLMAFRMPEDDIINLESDKGIKKLGNIFKNRELFIVCDENSAKNLKFNKSKFTKNNIHGVILKKSNINIFKVDSLKNIYDGKIIELNIDKKPNYERMDERAYKHLKLRGVSYTAYQEKKDILGLGNYKIEIIEDFGNEITNEVGKYVFTMTNLYENIGEGITEKKIRLLIIRKIEDNKIIGFSAFHQIGTAQIYGEFKNIEISNYVRENTSGKITIIDGIYVAPKENNEEVEQLLLTETLLHNLKNDFTYAVFCNTLLSNCSDSLLKLLELHGFNKISILGLEREVYAVDMKFPICVTMDLEEHIKEPIISNVNVRKVIDDSRNRLRHSLSKQYPNTLILALNTNILQKELINSLREILDIDLQNDKKLKDYLCVPISNFLHDKKILDLATKSLHIEKIINYDTNDFTIGEIPYSLSLDAQIELIKEYNKKVILIDDVMNKCVEISKVEKLLKGKGVEICKIVAGILSSNGKDIMEIQGKTVECSYFIPNLRFWIRESLIYPFIGGNTVSYDGIMPLNVIPSVNYILPYTASEIYEGFGGYEKDNMYELSLVSLCNSLEIFKVIEQEYKVENAKALVLKDIGHITYSPRIPIKGTGMKYDMEYKISKYIENDICDLRRLEKLIK